MTFKVLKWPVRHLYGSFKAGAVAGRESDFAVCAIFCRRKRFACRLCNAMTDLPPESETKGQELGSPSSYASGTATKRRRRAPSHGNPDKTPCVNCGRVPHRRYVRAPPQSPRITKVNGVTRFAKARRRARVPVDASIIYVHDVATSSSRTAPYIFVSRTRPQQTSSRCHVPLGKSDIKRGH